MTPAGPGAAHLKLHREGAVVTCALSNPPHHTLTARGVQELGELLDTLEADPGVRILVLTGGGEGVFVAHYEVGELAEASERAGGAGAEPEAGPVRLHPLNQLTLRLEASRLLTVAALNGSAAGGGLELALGCDFRLAAQGPFLLGLPETSVGILPGAGGTQRLARLLGVARALDLILHARLFGPQEALELGVVHRLFPAEGFAQEVARFAADLAERAPIALREAKRAIREGVELPLREGLQVEQRAFERTMRTKDAASAMRAWLRGEPYAFRGE